MPVSTASCYVILSEQYVITTMSDYHNVLQVQSFAGCGGGKERTGPGQCEHGELKGWICQADRRGRGLYPTAETLPGWTGVCGTTRQAHVQNGGRRQNGSVIAVPAHACGPVATTSCIMKPLDNWMGSHVQRHRSPISMQNEESEP